MARALTPGRRRMKRRDYIRLSSLFYPSVFHFHLLSTLFKSDHIYVFCFMNLCHMFYFSPKIYTTLHLYITIQRNIIFSTEEIEEDR